MNESGSPAEQAFLDGIIAEPDDDLRRLVFADWLEENRQEPRAKFIRARIVLDTQVPEFGSYADALDAVQDCGYELPGVELPGEYFQFVPPTPGFADCWASDEGWFERGLPALASFAGDPEQVRLRHWDSSVNDLIAETPIRAFHIANLIYDHADAFFPDVARPELRRLSLDASADENDEYGQHPDDCVRLLAESPAAHTLNRLHIKGTPNVSTFQAIEAATFDRLEHFGVEDYNDIYDASHNFFSRASWLPQLRSFVHTLWGEATFGPVTLPNLHSFGLCVRGHESPRSQALHVCGVELPNLRRLYLRDLDLRGDGAKAVAAMPCGELVELWMRRTKLVAMDLKRLLAAPWARRIEVLVLEGIDGDAAEAITASPCAASLRILRLDGVAVPALDRPGRFPNLTTLELSRGNAAGLGVKAGKYAELLKTLSSPRLRTVRIRAKESKLVRQAFESNPSLRDCRLIFE